MKKIAFLLTFAFALGCAVTSCLPDEGNYEYLSDEEVSKIVFDTTGISHDMYTIFGAHYHAGDTIRYTAKIDYAYPERLKVCWLCLPLENYTYKATQVGNALVYPEADTVSYTNELCYIFTQSAGQVRFYCCAEDTETGVKEYFMPTNYSVIESAGQQSGLCLLTETADGNTDLEFYCSTLQLIYGAGEYPAYYSSTHGAALPGKPRFIAGTHTGKTSANGYLVCTDDNLYRLAADGLTTMDEWDGMFYETPATFNPQAAVFTNSADFLINDGELYTLYVSQPNSRKFMSPVNSGDEKSTSLFPFVMFNSKTTWRPAENAINADQVLFDVAGSRFVPYYAGHSSFGAFKTTEGTAVVDANRVPGTVKKILNAGNNDTYVITIVDGTPYLYRYTFYNVADNGDFSTEGERSIIDLSGCEHLTEATLFGSCASGAAFYYAYGGTVYSFSPSSGQTTSQVVHTGEAGEEVTSLYAWGSIGGGWPTSNVILYIGLWDGTEGKLVEYEMNHASGMPMDMWGPMFGGAGGATISTGWGKIVDMTCLDAR